MTNTNREQRNRNAKARLEGPLVLLILAVLAGVPLWGLSLLPSIFYSDLESGPNTGGQNNKGVFVTIYGKNFGASQGTSVVTVGGVKADNYPTWTDAKVTFQLGPGAQTGSIQVTTSQGKSNGVPFSVRPGGIYFVSTKGNDSNNGSFTAPWKTLVKAVTSIPAGGTIYAMDGVAQTTVQLYNAALYPTTGGAANAYNALVAYPGATVTVGDPAGVSIGIQLSMGNHTFGGPYWVFSGLILRARTQAIQMSNIHHVRFVGCDISCPNGDGSTGCAAFTASSGLGEYFWFLGNNVHDVSQNVVNGASKLYHDVYFTTDSNHVVAAWNQIHDSRACRAIQFHSSPLSTLTVSGATFATPVEITTTAAYRRGPGQLVQISGVTGNTAANGIFLVKTATSATTFTIAHLDGSAVAGNAFYAGGGSVATTGFSQYDISVHDNLIHGNPCDGINLATVDPSRGPVQVYNNIIYHVGTGPDPHDGLADYACIYVPGGLNNGPPPSGQVEVFNNTCYDSGSVNTTSSLSGLWSGPNSSGNGFTVRLRDNIFYSIGGEHYLTTSFTKSGKPANLLGSNNLWYGNGSAPGSPTKLTDNVNANPLFLNLAIFDFHLLSGSAAINAGVTTPAATDFDGVTRPAGSAYDIGAFESP